MADTPCPNCNGVTLTERSSFKTAAEALEGGAATTVVVDLMACDRCGINFPSIRGRKKYSLMTPEKLSAMMAELEEARKRSSELSGTLRQAEKRSRGLEAEIEEFKLRSQISLMESRVANLESENDGLDLRKRRLKEAIELVAAGISGPPRGKTD